MDKKYRKYFRDRLCKDGETLKQYRKLFDAKRTPEEKRKEFRKNYKRLLEELMRLEGFKSENIVSACSSILLNVILIVELQLTILFHYQAIK